MHREAPIRKLGHVAVRIPPDRSALAGGELLLKRERELRTVRTWPMLTCAPKFEHAERGQRRRVIGIT